jgi:hypothetical protein
MTTFSFQGTCEVTLQYEDPRSPQIIQVKYELQTLGNLNRKAYFLSNNKPNKEGLKLLTTVFVQGLGGCVAYGSTNKYLDEVDHVKYILNQIRECAYPKERIKPTGAPTVAFQGMCQVTFQHDGVSKTSQLKGVNFNLTNLTNLNPVEYLLPNDLPTENGLRLLTTAFLQGLGACIDYGKKNELWDGDHIQYCIEQFLRVVEVKGKTFVESYFEEEKQPGTVVANTRMKTNEHLVAELMSRNIKGRYDILIQRADKFWYHDYKQPNDVPALPKLQLINDLAPFPELADIRQRVIDGVYDEVADKDDIVEMARFLMPPTINRKKE